MPRLWPLMLPREGESDNDFWIAARKIARDALTKWVKIIVKGRTYVGRDAEEGTARLAGAANVARISAGSMIKVLILDWDEAKLVLPGERLDRDTRAGQIAGRFPVFSFVSKP